MSDDSDEGYIQGESFYTQNNPKFYNYNKEQENYEDEESYNNNNYYYNYNIIEDEKNLVEDEENTSNHESFNDNKRRNYNINSYEYQDFHENYYYYYNKENYNKNRYHYYNNNKFNDYNTFKKNRKNYSNTYENDKPKYKFIKSKEYYLTSFEMKFISWLIKTVCEENKNISFVSDKKINQEIIDSFNKLYIFNKKKDKIDNNKEKIEIKDIEIKHIIQQDINIQFNLVITDIIDVFFIKKNIEIKVIVKVELLFNKIAKIYFYVNQYKLSLCDELKDYKKIKDSDDILIKTIDKDIKKEDNSPAFELDLNYKKNSNNSEKNKVCEPNEELKLCIFDILNEL